jgi:peptidyl-prolyl cis-trans isomerase D
MALKWMREKLKYLKGILWAVVAAFVIALFFDFGANRGSGAQGQEAAATVGGEVISYADYQRSYRNLESYYQQQTGQQLNQEMIKLFNLRQRALDQLIDRKILLLEAKKVGLKATDAEVEEAILSFPYFKDEKGNFIGRDEVRERLRGSRMSEREFAEAVREDVLLQKLNDVMAHNAYVSDADVERAFREQNEKAKIRFVQLPGTELGAVFASQDEIQRYFTENGDKYKKPEQRIVDYLLVDTNKVRETLEVPEAQIVEFYEKNKDATYTTQEQVRARHILLRVKPERNEAASEAKARELKAQIESGTDFATLAQQFSDDESNASRGGDLGYFGRGQMVPAFSSAAFDAQINAVVGPVKTDFGYHLIQVLDKQATQVRPFEEVKTGIKARLQNEQLTPLVEAKAREIYRKAVDQKVATAEQLKALAEKEGVSFETTPAFGQADPAGTLGKVQEFNDAVFKLEVGKLGDAVKVGRGWAIPRLQRVDTARPAELTEVQDKVRIEVEKVKRRELAKQRLAGVRGQIVSASKTLDAVAAELSLQVQESEEFSREGVIAGISQGKKVIEAALGMEVGEWSQPLESELGAVLFQVMERKKFDVAAFEKEKADVRDREERKKAGLLTASLLEHRKRDLVPQYDAKLAADFAAPAKPPGARG